VWAVPAQVCNQTPPIGGAPSLMTFRCALDAWVLSVYDVRLAVVLLLHFRCCHDLLDLLDHFLVFNQQFLQLRAKLPQRPLVIHRAMLRCVCVCCV